VIIAAMQQQQISVPENSWVGHTTMAGFGIMLLVISVMCIKGNKKSIPMGPWGPMFGALMNKVVGEPTKRLFSKWGSSGSEGLDWKSLMTFFIGMWAMTSIVSSTGGTVLNLVNWFQDLVLKMSGWPVLSDIGAGGICILLFVLAMRNKDDSKQDLTFGAVCGFFFPLGGGAFASLTLQIGQWIPEIMRLGK
jgi:hypothetical protein